MEARLGTGFESAPTLSNCSWFWMAQA